MIAHITLILTILLSVAHLPCSDCIAATDNDQTGRSHECPRCNHQDPESLSWPFPPASSCCSSRTVTLAVFRHEEGPQETIPIAGSFRDADRRTSAPASDERGVTLSVSKGPLNRSGGRGHLMQTCRLLI